ncbi:MAG: hypothetical protein FWD17_06160 [Polyangiaceae bacterium]|nr:hypothetical protein [Polyangiaceae bacterium]
MADPATPSTASTALVRRPSEGPNPWDDVRLQRLWLAIERREWRSLAVLGASTAVETIRLAELLAQLAWRYRGQPSSVCDLRDLSMRLIEYQVQEMRDQIDEGTRLVVALRSIFENPTATPIAKQTDAVVLCIVLGDTNFKAAEETVATIGRDRVIGSIILRPHPKRRGKRANGR